MNHYREHKEILVFLRDGRRVTVPNLEPDELKLLLDDFQEYLACCPTAGEIDATDENGQCVSIRIDNIAEVCG